MKVGILLAAHDYSSSWFSHDLAKLMGYTAREWPDWELNLYQSTGTWLPQVRHNTIAQALQEGNEWLLLIDNDMRFPDDSLIQLLRRDKPVVAVNYTARHVPFHPVAVSLEGERVYTDYDSQGIEEIGSVGLGLMLVRADIVRGITPPWFMLGWNGERYTGEDNYFCRKIREAGEHIWLDHDLSHDVTHMGIIEFEQSHAVKAKRTIQTEA